MEQTKKKGRPRGLRGRPSFRVFSDADAPFIYYITGSWRMVFHIQGPVMEKS